MFDAAAANCYSNHSAEIINPKTNEKNNGVVKLRRIKDKTKVPLSADNSTQVLQTIIENEIEKNKAPLDQNVLEHLGQYIEEPFNIIETYFGSQYLERLVRHQIESYNHFINYQIQRTIQMFNSVKIHSENDFSAEIGDYLLEVDVSFENFKLYPPQIHENNGATKTMLPQEARIRNFTYGSTMTVDLNITYTIKTLETLNNLSFRILPVP